MHLWQNLTHAFFTGAAPQPVAGTVMLRTPTGGELELTLASEAVDWEFLAQNRFITLDTDPAHGPIGIQGWLGRQPVIADPATGAITTPHANLTPLGTRTDGQLHLPDGQAVADVFIDGMRHTVAGGQRVSSESELVVAIVDPDAMPATHAPTFPLGVLNVESPTPYAFDDEDDPRFLHALAVHAYTMVSSARTRRSSTGSLAVSLVASIAHRFHHGIGAYLDRLDALPQRLAETIARVQQVRTQAPPEADDLKGLYINLSVLHERLQEASALSADVRAFKEHMARLQVVKLPGSTLPIETNPPAGRGIGLRRRARTSGTGGRRRRASSSSATRRTLASGWSRRYLGGCFAIC